MPAPPDTTASRTLIFVERAADARPPHPSTDIVVLDTSWTPTPGDRADRPDLVPLRPVVDRVLAQRNVVDESLEQLDEWAAQSHLADLFEADGVTWWFRIRMLLRWDAHELMLWRLILDELAPSGRYREIVVPVGRVLLAAAARAPSLARPRARASGANGGAPNVRTAGYPAVVRSLAGRVIGRGGPAGNREALLGLSLLSPIGGRKRPTLERAVNVALAAGRRAWPAVRSVARRARPQAASRRALLDARAGDIAAQRGGVLVVNWPRAFQVVESSGERRFTDPQLAPVVDRLRADDIRVTSVALAADYWRDRDWAVIESDEQVLPDAYVRERWPLGDPDVHTEEIPRRLAHAAVVPYSVDGTDLGPALRSAMDRFAGEWLVRQRLWLRSAESVMRLVGPDVVFLDREGSWAPWIAAARRLRIPVVAVQHGMIYRLNPEYCQPPHPKAVRPDVTCVFGPYERSMLVERGNYDPDRVVVTGSPRAPALAQEQLRANVTERERVRRELGVDQNDKLVVISVAHNAVMGSLYSVSMVAQVLGGALPGIHVVIKLHPQDESPNAYRELLDGLAAASGYEAPSLTVVRDADIYRLLRAADAHLGQHSTVLSDAVVAGTPNMIALCHAYADPLGYVEAGVATPVRSVEDVRAFMHDPRPPSPKARTRFIEAHYAPGDAAGRIADVIRTQMSGPPGLADTTAREAVAVP